MLFYVGMWQDNYDQIRLFICFDSYSSKSKKYNITWKSISKNWRLSLHHAITFIWYEKYSLSTSEYFLVHRIRITKFVFKIFCEIDLWISEGLLCNMYSIRLSYKNTNWNKFDMLQHFNSKKKVLSIKISSNKLIKSSIVTLSHLYTNKFPKKFLKSFIFFNISLAKIMYFVLKSIYRTKFENFLEKLIEGDLIQ